MKTEIEKFNPCIDAVEYRKQFNTFQEAWEQCPRGDWMFWLAQTLKVNIKTLTLAKAHCANTVRHLMKDKRSTNAIDVAIRFGEGKATREELDAAYAAAAAYTTGAAADAADTTYAAAAAYTTGAAADATANTADATAANVATYTADAAYAAAYAADATAYAAYAATYAAYAATYATYAAYAADAKKKNQLETANICKLILTEEVFKILEIKNT